MGLGTYLVDLLLFLVTLLVGGGLLIVRLTLGFTQVLPLVAEHLADLAWREGQRELVDGIGVVALTEGDAGVLLADLLTVVVGKEHVGGQTTLGGVGV